jgi:hypothetical protein
MQRAGASYHSSSLLQRPIRPNGTRLAFLEPGRLLLVIMAGRMMLSDSNGLSTSIKIQGIPIVNGGS